MAYYVFTVRKNMDYTMLPLECLYLNKNALINVVGQPVSYNKYGNIVKTISLLLHYNTIYFTIYIYIYLIMLLGNCPL